MVVVFGFGLEVLAASLCKGYYTGKMAKGGGKIKMILLLLHFLDILPVCLWPGPEITVYRMLLGPYRYYPNMAGDI